MGRYNHLNDVEKCGAKSAQVDGRGRRVREGALDCEHER